ncbi:hypothetical protein DPMN_068868 [Dreissena polymorpha]|uniref:Uncharacterized protein n=1 Tax=Dreissena polymorpha TaxID=45954 RepID=A0A9D3Z2F1_DREPO|nr:hypothetical protein DPMN_068868 [Dreissena polymorpha]
MRPPSPRGGHARRGGRGGGGMRGRGGRGGGRGRGGRIDADSLTGMCGTLHQQFFSLKEIENYQG